MRSKSWLTLISVLVFASLLLASCAAPAATETAAPTVEVLAGEETTAPMETEPAVTEPVATEPAGEEPMVTFPELTEAAFEGLEYAAPDCEYGGILSKITAVDELTVVFDLCVPDPAFQSKVAFSAFSIQPREWLEAGAANQDIISRPIGTGPYMLEAWNRGDSIVMTRNPNYWGEPGVADKVIFRWSTEGAARLLELQSGTVDGIDNPSPDDFEVISNDSSLQLLERQALNIFYLGMTNTFEPFDNLQVRQAIAQGIDRQRIVDNFYPAGSVVPTNFTPCDIPNGCTGDEWYEYDPEAARALLAEAGYPDGFETTIYYRDVFRSYLPEPGLVATDLQAQLADIGITAEIEVMESGAFIEASNGGNLNGLYLLGWNADYPHITNFLDFHFGASNPQFGDPHPEIYETLQEAAQIADPAESEELYVEANNAIRELVPMVPIATGGSAVAFRADVENGHASPLGNEYFAVVDPGGRDQFVWMQNNEPISLFCADETDGESLRACEQMLESLLSYEVGGTEVREGLATSCEPNEELTQYTCTLRDGVTFHNGFGFDADDVVVNYAASWDGDNPLHVGNTGQYQYFATLWNSLLNPPPAEE